MSGIVPCKVSKTKSKLEQVLEGLKTVESGNKIGKENVKKLSCRKSSGALRSVSKSEMSL